MASILWLFNPALVPFAFLILILLSLGLVSTNLKCVMDAFFKNEFTALIKKNGEMAHRYQKSFFLFYFWVEKKLSPNMWDCPLNPTSEN